MQCTALTYLLHLLERQTKVGLVNTFVPEEHVITIFEVLFSEIF